MKSMFLILMILIVSNISIVFRELCTRIYFGCISNCPKGNHKASCENECLNDFNKCISGDETINQTNLNEEE